MAVTQAVLPRFRERRSGVLVNVTSSVTLARMPLVAVYSASKNGRPAEAPGDTPRRTQRDCPIQGPGALPTTVRRAVAREPAG